MTPNERLVAAFVRALGIESGQVVDSLTYNTIPQWDSIAHMQLITELEDEFDVMLGTSNIIDMSSVGKAKEILATHGIEF